MQGILGAVAQLASQRIWVQLRALIIRAILKDLMRMMSRSGLLGMGVTTRLWGKEIHVPT